MKKEQDIYERVDELRQYIENFPCNENSTQPQKALYNAVKHELEYLETLI